MKNYEENIINICEKWKNGGRLNSDAVCRLISLLRQLIERDGKKFDAINFYANWLLHTRLDRGESKRKVSNIKDIISSQLDVSELIDKINEALAHEIFLDELRKLFREYNLGNYFEYHENRKRVFQQLALDLTDKPLDPNVIINKEEVIFCPEKWVISEDCKMVISLKGRSNEKLICIMTFASKNNGSITKEFEIGVFFKN
ncbi:MAG: hypothetical protein KDD52_04930 [Bdellovibrionales bacterium]|nr:hypothetical protein [Bdellovibrionales bacterium]